MMMLANLGLIKVGSILVEFLSFFCDGDGGGPTKIYNLAIKVEMFMDLSH